MNKISLGNWNLSFSWTSINVFAGLWLTEVNEFMNSSLMYNAFDIILNSNRTNPTNDAPNWKVI
ncbi:MAG: hypothetical protein ACTS7I_00150 [Candidatus Hodgkinia cicadicola]